MVKMILECDTLEEAEETLENLVRELCPHNIFPQASRTECLGTSKDNSCIEHFKEKYVTIKIKEK